QLPLPLDATDAAAEHRSDLGTSEAAKVTDDDLAQIVGRGPGQPPEPLEGDELLARTGLRAVDMLATGSARLRRIDSRPPSAAESSPDAAWSTAPLPEVTDRGRALPDPPTSSA